MPQQASFNNKQPVFGENNRLLNIFLFLAITLILGWLLVTLKFVFLPMLLAAFITFMLSPLVEFLVKYKVPRPLSLIFTLVTASFLIWFLGNYVGRSFQDFSERFPAYAERLNNLASELKSLDKYNVLSVEKLNEWLSKISLGNVISSTFSSFFNILSYMVVTVLFVLYFLPAFYVMPNKIRKAFPGPRGHILCRAMESIGHQVQSYMLAKSCTSIFTGIGVTLPCLFFGVDFAVTWGVFAAFLNFVPTIGAIISCLPPILICALQFGWPETMWLGIVLSVVMVGTGNFLEPKILGKSVNLSPTAALVSLFFWGWLWGGVGMLVAVPATAMIKFTCDNIKGLKPVGSLLGN